MAIVTPAATQMACSWDLDENIQKAEEQVTLAAEDGAQIILLQELFQHGHHYEFDVSDSSGC